MTTSELILSELATTLVTSIAFLVLLLLVVVILLVIVSIIRILWVLLDRVSLLKVPTELVLANPLP